MEDFVDLGFKVPERCNSYTVRLKPSLVLRVDQLLAGASRSMLIESLLRRWVDAIVARRRERDRERQISAVVPSEPEGPKEEEHKETIS
jgi:hypothetical protein